MVENYAVLSLETHLFFSRIMKEHALFLEAGFPCAETEWIEKAARFREQFEELLSDTLRLANGRVNREILMSEELVTEFTLPAERRTSQLSGIPIDSRLTMREQSLRCLCHGNTNREVLREINRMNQRALALLEEFIRFKERILKEVRCGKLFTANYPLLIEHILREARLYCETIKELQEDKMPSYKNLKKTEDFWNQIMMEHALFIRGLLDPSEQDLIETADQFAGDYEQLLKRARHQDCRASKMADTSLEETLKYRRFKEAGASGILSCKIESIILPLLADHVLREANHYIRLLQTDTRN